jgi:hypothetical protein
MYVGEMVVINVNENRMQKFRIKIRTCMKYILRGTLSSLKINTYVSSMIYDIL